MSAAGSGRRHAPRMDLVVTGPAGEPPRWRVASPGVGWFVPAVAVDHVVAPGDELGTLDVLGVRYALHAPKVHGLVLAPGDARVLAARGVGYGEVLAWIDPALGGAGERQAAATAASTDGAAGATGLVFAAPTSGRYYGKPGPGKPPFVAVGDEIGEGTTVCLLEVMKTFNRVTYGGGGLPPRARVAAILAADESDVDAGAPLLQLEAIP
jgi:acetyl-CoA carboxylase biotin carboxyl carrier protein